MALKLSILIATMPKRFDSYANLIRMIYKQYTGSEIEIISDNVLDYNIGAKRNKLLQLAKGDYIVFIDDDDTVSDDYVSKILQAIETGPDCVGISGTITTNGQNEQQWHISKDYGSWFEQDSIYYRTPNHISPVRRELALQVGFPEISHGEDYVYSIGLIPILKTETKILGNLYHYDYYEHK